MPEAHRLNYLRMESRYDDHIWRIFVPAAQELLGEKSHRAVNKELKQIAVALVVARPVDYFVWVAKAFRRGIGKMASDMMLNPASLVIFLLTLFTMLAYSVRFLDQRRRPGEVSRQTAVLFLLACPFALLKLTTVILVSIPIERMTSPAGLFVPVVFTALLADAISGLFSKPHAPSPRAETSPS